MKLLGIRRLFTRKSALTTMIVTNTLVLLIPLAMGLFLYTKVETSLEGNSNRSNAAMLEQLKLALDNKLAEANNLMQQIVFDPKLDYMLKIPAAMSDADKYEFVAFMRDKMNRYRTLTSDFIYDYYLYFAASDTIVKPELLTESHTFYPTYYNIENMSYDEWLSYMKQSHLMAYSPVVTLNGIQLIGKEVIPYAQTLPMVPAGSNAGTLVLMIDVDKIKQAFAQLESASHSVIYILDESGQTIMSTGDQPFPDELQSKVKADSGLFEYKLAGVDHMVSFTRSAEAKWRYVSFTPNDVFLQQVNQIQHWALGLLAFCLAAGLLAVIAAAYSNYMPLRNTVRAIMLGKEMTGRPASNEYDFIRQTFEGSLHEEKHLRGKLKEQAPFIRANYLTRLLNGHMDVDISPEHEEMLRFMDLSFASDKFAVVLVKIEDIYGTAAEDEPRWAHARFIVSNIGVDLIEARHKGFAIELDRDRLVLLINFSQADEESAEADVREIVNKLAGMLQEKFQLGVTIAAGAVHQGPKAIRDSYPEALAALEYRLVKGENTVLHFRDILDAQPHYYYPLELEIQLVNFVRSGDVENVHKLLDKMYSMNFDSNAITPELGRCLFFNMTSTLLKIINTANRDQEEVLGPDFDPIKTVFGAPTAQGMHQKTKELYEKLARSFQTDRSDHHSQLLQEMVELVERHLDDPNLSLAMIADRLQMSPPYLSTFFKKNQGQNLQDYIARKRIDAAKKWLEDKELTILQVAQAVGYNNDVVFIRAFKKLEGVTPGKYRESASQPGDSSEADWNRG